MSKFKIIPISKAYAEKIRSGMKDDFGHELHSTKLSGRALCRFCLADGGPEHKHILFSYLPVENTNPYAEVGPVFIHENCEQYQDVYSVPHDLTTRRYLTVRGYSAEHNLIKGYMTSGNDIVETIHKLFRHAEVESIHINDASSGCYFLKLARE